MILGFDFCLLTFSVLVGIAFQNSCCYFHACKILKIAAAPVRVSRTGII